jgi:hypothetical protein
LNYDIDFIDQDAWPLIGNTLKNFPVLDIWEQEKFLKIQVLGILLESAEHQIEIN